jgi:hypothetical protein
MPDVTGDLGGGWTIDDEIGGLANTGEWDTANGDLGFLFATNGNNRIDGFAWSPDGSVLTISNGLTDVIQSFECSTPFQPNTASLATSRAVTNGNTIQFNDEGSLLFTTTVVGDQISSYPCTNYKINTTGTIKHLTKSDVGFTGSPDGSWSASFDLDTVFWSGDDGSDAIKKIATPDGDLDNFTVNQTYNNTSINPSASRGESHTTLDGKLFIKCNGSSGLRFRRMTTANDLSTVIDWLTNQAVNSLSVIDMRPSHIWFNPKDTRYIWVSDDPSSRAQFCRYKTNTPEV